MVVFLPLGGLEGVVGRFFSALAMTLSAAVLLSLAIARDGGAARRAPGSCARAPRPPPVRPGTYAGYARAVGPMLRRRWPGAADRARRCSPSGVVAARFVGTDFLPTMDEGAFVLDYFLPAGTSLTDTDAVARKIEAI